MASDSAAYRDRDIRIDKDKGGSLRREREGLLARPNLLQIFFFLDT